MSGRGTPCYLLDVATILAHISVVEGKETAFESIARGLFDASHANDDGLLRYEYWRGEEPGSYYALLSFRDFAAFIAHQTSDHHESASSELAAVVRAIRLEWVDPVNGASNLPATQPQSLDGDLGELTRVYARRFAVREAKWWEGVRGE